jgi:hypothetical protein
MKKVPVGLALRDRLGEIAVRDLNDYVEEHLEAGRVDVVNAISERFDYRINACATREDMIIGFARVEKKMSRTKTEIILWSFAFWISQVAALFLLK